MTNSRVWFITGSSSGFGRAIVDAARARGERVVATARRPGGDDASRPARGNGHHVLRPGRADACGRTAHAGSGFGSDRADQLDGRSGDRAGLLRLLRIQGLLGRSLRAAPPLDAYSATSGQTRAYIEREDGNQAGSPAKTAAAILTALDAQNPPLRLALGADAVDGIRAKHEALRAELAQWEELGRGTAFDA